jgi:phospho-N-acetylmuramoyl-pentapeptide-transferase
MLLILAQWLQDDYSFFRVFNYITFRAVMATLTALLIGLISGPWVIRRLTELKMGQAVRTDGPQTHLVKSGTPTMGGVLILIGIFTSCVLWADLTNRFIWIVMLVTFGFGLIGWVDDYRKVARKDPRGMASREKFFWQTVIGLFAAIYLAFSVSEVNNLKVLQLFIDWVRSGFSLDLPAKSNLYLPFVKEVSYPLGVMGFIILSYLVIVGSSNAVNLTDGLDGLVIMPVILVGAALGAFAYVMGNAIYAKYLLFPSHAHFKADAAILVRYHQDFLVEILGAITRDEFFKVAQIKNLGYHDNYAVTQDQLTPIEEFKNARERQEA